MLFRTHRTFSSKFHMICISHPAKSDGRFLFKSGIHFLISHRSEQPIATLKFFFFFSLKLITNNALMEIYFKNLKIKLIY